MQPVSAYFISYMTPVVDLDRDTITLASGVDTYPSQSGRCTYTFAPIHCWFHKEIVLDIKSAYLALFALLSANRHSATPVMSIQL